MSTAVAAEERVPVATWIGFSAMGLGMFMAILDIQVVATSLPTIREALGIAPEQMSWVQTAYLIAEVIAILRTHARVPLRAHSDPALRRAVDVERIVGSHERATRDTGWTPRVPLDETLGALLDDWRERLRAA